MFDFLVLVQVYRLAVIAERKALNFPLVALHYKNIPGWNGYSFYDFHAILLFFPQIIRVVAEGRYTVVCRSNYDLTCEAAG